MTQSIRDAAQALLDAHDAIATVGELVTCWNALRTALSAPQPTADERVAELMRKVDEALCSSITSADDTYRAVEQSARALLSASQEDAEHAAMYRWLRDRGGRSWRIYPDGKPKQAIHATGEYYDDAVRAAMRDNP